MRKKKLKGKNIGAGRPPHFGHGIVKTTPKCLMGGSEPKKKKKKKKSGRVGPWGPKWGWLTTHNIFSFNFFFLIPHGIETLSITCDT